jgi:hypothetical protein
MTLIVHAQLMHMTAVVMALHWSSSHAKGSRKALPHAVIGEWCRGLP